MFFYFKKYQFHFLLILIGISWLATMIGFLDIQTQTIIYPDASDYNDSATNLYWFYRGHGNRPILMAFIYGAPLLIGASANDLYCTSIFINIFLWVWTSLLLFAIFKKFVSEKLAFLFVVAFIFFIGTTLYNFHFLAEIPFLFFLVLGFYFLQKYNQTKIFKWLVIALSVIVLSVLIKPGSKFFAIIMLLYFARSLFTHYRQKIMFLLYASLGLCFIQATGVKYQFGDFTISYIDSVTFYNYLFSKADCYGKGTEFDQLNNPRADFLFTHKVHEQKKIANADIIEQLQNNKLNVLKAYLNNFIGNATSGTIAAIDYSNVKGTKKFEQSQSVLYLISKYQNCIMTILGVFLSLLTLRKYHKDLFLLFTSLFILYIFGISGISSDQGDRFHIITYPFTLILLINYLKLHRSLHYFKQRAVFTF